MKYKLIKPINENYSAIEQILTNRNIPYNDLQDYLNTTDEDISCPEWLGENALWEAMKHLALTIKENKKAIKVVVIQPGAESEEIIQFLNENNIEYIEACLLLGISLYKE